MDIELVRMVRGAAAVIFTALIECGPDFRSPGGFLTTCRFLQDFVA
jgi:hypothetical protein